MPTLSIFIHVRITELFYLPFTAGRAGVGCLAAAGGCVQQPGVEAGSPRLQRPRHRARVLGAEAAGPIRGEYSVTNQ